MHFKAQFIWSAKVVCMYFLTFKNKTYFSIEYAYYFNVSKFSAPNNPNLNSMHQHNQMCP